jgi:hypothetical protein
MFLIGPYLPRSSTAAVVAGSLVQETSLSGQLPVANSEYTQSFCWKKTQLTAPVDGVDFFHNVCLFVLFKILN